MAIPVLCLLIACVVAIKNRCGKRSEHEGEQQLLAEPPALSTERDVIYYYSSTTSASVQTQTEVSDFSGPQAEPEPEPEPQSGPEPEPESPVRQSNRRGRKGRGSASQAV